jgi:hypothetical protein
MDDVPLIAAGVLGLLAASVHGVAGEILVVKRLAQATLPASALGGPRMTQAMVHVSWHVTTAAFLAAGVALLLAGTVLPGDAARALAIAGAVAFTTFAAVAVTLGAANTRNPLALFRHPGPAILSVTAAIAWWGAL